jgi:hypothetical protein
MTIPQMNAAVAQRRQEFPADSKFLSDWQVHCAHLVCAAILDKAQASPVDVGARYIPFPTGSGKTVGAVWGMVQVVKKHPDKRICFLTPYQKAVDTVYARLVDHLGPDVVGMYHGEAFVDKEEELTKQVVVLTHQFVPYNKGALDDRDIFVIDEAIYATAEISLTLEDFAAVLNWSTSNGVLAAEFDCAHTFAVEMYDELKQAPDKRFHAAPKAADLSWAKAISDYDLTDKLGQTVSPRQDVAGVQIFCEALLLGLVFMDRGNTIDPNKFSPTFNAAILGIPKLDNTIILSATGGLTYDIAGTIQHSSWSRKLDVPASHDDVTLVELPDPGIKEQYKAWTTPTIRTKVTDYLDGLLKEVLETEAYVSMPLAVYDKCLRNYFGLGAGELTFPQTVTKHGKTLHLSHHRLSIGTNAYKDCPAVIYLWANHLPKQVILKERTALEGKRLTYESLILPNSKKQQGPFAKMKDAKYIDNIIQQIGRGNIRQITGKGKAGKMTAYVLSRPDDFSYLSTLMSTAKTRALGSNGLVQQPTGRLAKVMEHLKIQRGNNVKMDDMVNATGIQSKEIKKAVSDNVWEIERLGYQFQPGERGRGKAGSFTWVG